MSNPSITVGANHVYRLSDGDVTTVLPSVTTIIHASINKSDVLMGWAKRVVADNAVNQYEALGRIMDSLGLDGAKRWLKSQPDQERDKAADLGTRVHALAEAVGTGQEVEVSDDEEAFIVAYSSWLDNEAKPNGISVMATETKVWNLSGYQYAGTADVWLNGPDGILIADYKTGKHVYPHEVLMQLGAYDAAECWELSAPKPETVGGMVLHIRPDKATPRTFTAQDIQDGYAAFEEAYGIYRWMRRKF